MKPRSRPWTASCICWTHRKYTSVTREKQSIMPVLKATADQRRDLLAYFSSLAGVEEGPLATAPRR